MAAPAASSAAGASEVEVSAVGNGVAAVAVAASEDSTSTTTSSSSSASSSNDGGGDAALVTVTDIVPFDATAVVPYDAHAGGVGHGAPALAEARARRRRLGTTFELPQAWRTKLLKGHLDLEAGKAGNGRAGTFSHKKFVEWISDAEVEVHEVRESCKLLRDGSEVSFITQTTKRIRAAPGTTIRAPAP